jgi:sugar phosphate isomerase/epimerase
MTPLSRRSFLHTIAALGTAAWSSSRLLAIDPIQRRGKAPMRLSIAAYSYRDFLTGKKTPTMTLEDFVDLAADMGLPAVELTSYYFKDTSPAALAKLRGRCIRLGLDVSGGAVGNNFCLADKAKWQQEIDKVKEWIDRYAILGAKTIRIFAGNLPKGDSEEAARSRAVEAIQIACDHAAKVGIYLALENHGGITATAPQLLAIVKAVQHDWFGVNLDTGNFRTEDPYGDLALVAPYAVTVQVKTEVQPKGKKKEPADLARVVNILAEAKYRGYVALEYEAAEDPLQAIPRHVEELKKLLHAAS